MSPEGREPPGASAAARPSGVAFHVIIPARYASERLAGKVLADIAGKPMIVHVYENALGSGAVSVTVATDDPRVVSAVEDAGGRAVMTSAAHSQGTERVAEAAGLLQLGASDIIVNCQGDEPLLPGKVLALAAAGLDANPRASVATLAEPIESDSEFDSPGVVKVVLDRHGCALLFSRAPIPFARGERPADAPRLRHIGVYAYRHAYLRELLARDATPLERCERLEQLRTLQHGEHIHVSILSERVGPGVDTADDLAAVREHFSSPAGASARSDATRLQA